MTASASRREGYVVFWDWKEDPPYDEFNSRIASLLERGATAIRLVPIADGGDTHFVIVANCDVDADTAVKVYDTFLDRIPESGYEWTSDPGPIQLPE